MMKSFFGLSWLLPLLADGAVVQSRRIIEPREVGLLPPIIEPHHIIEPRRLSGKKSLPN
jgi:hypothetical protein